MGYQHGVLLKPMIEKIVAAFIDAPKNELASSRFAELEKAFSSILAFIPPDYQEEMKGLADGSGIPLKKIQLLNLFPEMFHCSGIVALPPATADGSLYHVRVLDYGVGKGLEKAGVLMVLKPDSKHAFLSVSYPGFIGCITGMNEEKISLGEIGGLGYGKWDGVPMSFLMREVLENTSSLDEAKSVFTNANRTCEYYYLIADGKNSSAVAVYATPGYIKFIEPGSSYALLQSEVEPKEKTVVSPFVFKNAEGLITLYGGDMVLGLFFDQPKNALLLTGYPKPERFPVLFKRFTEKEGSLTLADMQEMIKPPVTCGTNLHNAIFCPADLTIVVSHANGEEPASLQNYKTYSLKELLNSSP
jgi:hypothetical protein